MSKYQDGIFGGVLPDDEQPMPQPNNNPTDDELREQIGKLLNFFTEPGNGEKYLKDLEDDLVQLILADRAKHEREAVEPRVVSCMTKINCPKCNHTYIVDRQHLFPDDISTIPVSSQGKES